MKEIKIKFLIFHKWKKERCRYTCCPIFCLFVCLGWRVDMPSCIFILCVYMYFVHIFTKKYLHMLVHYVGIKTFVDYINTLSKMFILGEQKNSLIFIYTFLCILMLLMHKYVSILQFTKVIEIQISKHRKIFVMI